MMIKPIKQHYTQAEKIFEKFSTLTYNVIIMPKGFPKTVPAEKWKTKYTFYHSGLFVGSSQEL